MSRPIPVVTCNIGSKCIEVLKASMATYAPEHELIIHYTERDSFGKSFNEAMQMAIDKGYDEFIIANDDVVIMENSIPMLMEDVEKIKSEVGIEKMGFVATLVDNGRASQNVRYRFFQDEMINFGKWHHESLIKQMPVVAPIFAWYSKYAFEKHKFGPITWWSDDVICEDLIRDGMNVYVSRAYVHHSWSASVGTDYAKLRDEALPWVRENRPEYIKLFEERQGAPL